MAGNPLLDLPVSSNPLLDLLPPKPKAPTVTEGFLGRVGDFIVENLGGASETIRDNARTGRFAQDAAQDQGFFDRAGSLIERGAASFDQGLYNFLGGLGSQKARDAARSISTGTTGRDVAGTTSWEDVNSAGSLGSYVLDAGIESAPAMGALAVPFVGPLSLTASQTGNIASERARNNGRDFIERGDLANAAPAAILSTALDRFGLKGITNPAGRNVAGRIIGAGTREGLTEAAQSGIEYGGGTLGTDAGFNLGTALDQMLAGGVAGAGMGAGGRVAMEPVDAFMARRGGSQPQTGQGEPIDSDWEGSLDDLLGGNPQAAPANPLLTLPAPQTNTPARKAAPAATGNPIDDFMRRARGAESGGNDSAKNPRSSATGRYQFIDSTWLATYRQEFPNTGETDAQILAKRGDGKLQDRLMRRLTQGNAATLQGAGIPVDTGNLYLAHFAGPAGALALHRNPTASAESILGKSVIKANPFLKGMTGADVIQWAAGKMGGGGGTGFTSRAGNALDGMPEIDMPMPQRRDNNTAVLPELVKPDWRLPESETQGGASSMISPDNAMINGVQPEQQNDNQPARTGRAPLPDVPETRRGAVSQVVAPRVGPVDTMFELRDMAELVDSSNPAYDKTLQPRDRAGRAASGAQVASIAGTLDPRQLGDSRLASTGAPIIGPDGQVESGNGRIAALRQVYAQFPEQAAAYRQMIADTGLDATGLQFPVLVRRRTTEMTPEQRQAWTRAANERDTMAMSSTEQATADARQLPDSTLSLYRGGPVTAAGNRDFVRAFIERAVAPAERNAMVAPDGSLSVDGARRIRFALLARAYGDSELIGRIAEDTDTNIAAIGKALLEAAPAMAKLRAGIDAGEIPPQYDISANIAEAARMVARSRDTGQSLQGMLAQTDAFADPIAPETEAVLRLFYNDAEFKRARSAVKIADDLIDYARMAETQAANAAQGNDMFGNAPVLDSPATLLQRVRSGDDAAQGDMLAPAPESAYVAPDEQGSRPDRQTAPARPAGVERDGGSRSAVPTLARGQLRALGIAAQLRTEKAAALVGRTASTPRELAEIAQVYRDPRYETFRIFLTKGDTIVHATGVSSRSVAQAPLMPKGMKQDEFIAGILETMRNTGADGFYLLHNHPSGSPNPSAADKSVTRSLARLIPGFRAHVVINSNKYATIDLDAAGRTRSKVSNLNAGEDKLIAASKPHDALGRPILKGGDLAVLGKELQKPGWITVIGTTSKGLTRVIVDYPVSTAKKDVRALMAMARRIKTQSGSMRLFLVGGKDVMNGPTVARALASGIITDAIDNEGNAVFGVRGNKDKLPIPPARFVAQPAYHGSPYTFDKFSLDAIGSGEGAQAFGWGLYFAGRKEIAEFYRDTLTAGRKKNQARVDAWKAYDDALERFERADKMERTPFQQSEWEGFERKQYQDRLAELKAKAEYYGDRPTDGRLYQVDIPEDNEYLLWDAPLSKQPGAVWDQVIDAEQRQMGDPQGPELAAMFELGDVTGQEAYNWIAATFERGEVPDGVRGTPSGQSARMASEILKDAGIAGIKYLDGGSRSAGDGSYNYVLFDDSRIRIDAVEEDRVPFANSDIENPLVAVHNLSAEKFRNADDLGGLAAPSVAIIRADVDWGNFGDITLIGTPDLVNPKDRSAQGFNADVYSPRQPRAQYDLHGPTLKRLEADMQDAARDLGETIDIEFEPAKLSKEGLSAIEASPVAKLTYLRSIGVNVRPIYSEKPKVDRRLAAAAKGARDAWDLRNDPKFVAALRKVVDEEIAGAAKRDADIADRMRSRWFDSDGELNFRLVEDRARQAILANRPAPIDRWEMRKAIDKKIEASAKSAAAFRLWVQENYAGLIAGRFFEARDSGRRKDYNMENLVREMTRTIRDGEGYNYGVGSLRSNVAKQFKSLKDIKDARNSIISEKEMDAIKTEVTNEMFALGNKFAPYHGSGQDFGWMDIFTMFLKDLSYGRTREWQQEIFNEPVPESLLAEAREFLGKLRDLPTEYFEVKMQRPVAFSEFVGAAVPDNAPKDVIDRLKQYGLKIEKYPAGGSRVDAIERIASDVQNVLMEDTAPFDRGRDPGPSIADGLVDREGLTRDVQKIRDIVGNPVQALKGIMRSGLADNVRALTYSMDSRMRAFAKKYNSPAITELANHFYALAGTGGGAVTETYHEAVEREGFGRAGQALRILEPFIGDRAAMERITRMLRLPGERGRGIRREAEAAARIARLLKDTLDYRREAGEDIGEVTTGYFPRMLDVEKVVQNREAFLRNATELFRIHDAPNPRASAEAWLARTFDQYAGIDGGLDLIDLFHDTRPAGVGRRTTKPRKFGEDADRLLANFYQNDTGEVLTAYFIGGAKRAEEARRFGGEKMKALFDRIQEDIRASGLDGGDAAGALARMVATNLGRVETPSERVRGTVSFLQTASQLGTLDRALITSLSESMMGFVRGGARYGLPMLIRSIREFARQVRKAPPSEAARMAEALGIAQDALIGEALAARSGFERGQTSRRAQKVQQGFFRANGLEQWTTGTRAAATKMGQEFLYQLATDMASGRGRNAAKYLNELGIADPKGFSRWLLDGGNPTPEQLIGQEVSPNAQAYRTALLRFVNQTIMKPSRAEKPKWASHPVGGMFFSLMSYSYGFKKNVLDRTGRMIARGVKEKDPSLLYPAFGLAALFATHTVINNVIRQAILGGGREDEEEGITFTDWVEALDRAGLFGAASPLINAAFGVRYNRSLTESLAGPVVGRPLDAGTKVFNLATDRNSDNTNTGERAAAAALYDVVLEPALEAYGVTRFKGPAAAAIVWGSGNREGGVIPPDRDIFVEAVAGPKEEQ